MVIKMKKVVVSGASGFLGKNLIKRLSDDGIFVYALVRDLSHIENEFKNKKNIKIVELQLSDIVFLDKRINDNEIDVFFHFAWEGSSGPLRGNYTIQLENVNNTCQAVEVAKKINCKKFVFAESIMEYEIQKAINSNKDVSINTLYSTAKLTAKYMAKTIANSIGISYIGALISNIYGEGEKSARLINTTIRNLINKKHCSFSSGEQMYDFIYIDDAVSMLKLIGEKGEKNETYYIGNREPQKLKTFLIKLKDIVDSNALLGFCELPNPNTVLDYNEFDRKILFKRFNFMPQVSFEEGIKRTFESIKKEND